MAFPALRVRDAMQIEAGDQFLLYTTRGCFKNPTRDRGRVIGVARVTTPVKALDKPRVVAGRQFALECEFELVRLAARDEGVELAPLVASLGVFPSPSAWAIKLRRALLALPTQDARLLEHALGRDDRDRDSALASYGVAVPAGARPTSGAR